MKKTICAILAIALSGLSQATLAQSLSKQAAIALAERFVVENGYTSADPSRIKDQLDFESIEWTDDRNEMLKLRHSTLQPKAIGAKQGRNGDNHGWSIAFDYVRGTFGGRDVCRVVTMGSDGSSIRIEHMDGFRKFFVGFD